MSKQPVMRLTDAAATRVREIISQSEKPVIGLRIGVKPRGCSGLTYTMEYAEDIKNLEEVIEDKGVTVLVDPTATMFLVGTEMDYVDDRMQAGFVFRNPNEKARCGCGESFSV